LYVDTFEDETPIDLEVVKVEMARLEAELAAVRSQLARALEDLGA
jgi:hypothetical protein